MYTQRDQQRDRQQKAIKQGDESKSTSSTTNLTGNERTGTEIQHGHWGGKQMDAEAACGAWVSVAIFHVFGGHDFIAIAEVITDLDFT